MKALLWLFAFSLLVGAAACERNAEPLQQDTKTGSQEPQAPKGAPASQGRDVPSSGSASPNLGTLPDSGKSSTGGLQK